MKKSKYFFTRNLKGKKIRKDSSEINLLGTIDELNSYLGLIKVKIPDENEKQFIEIIQINLMKIMSHISNPDNEAFFITEKNLAELEDAIKKNSKSDDKNFKIPGSNETEAFIQISRTVARKAERCFIAAFNKIKLCPYAAVYLNLLSNYLFKLATQLAVSN